MGTLNVFINLSVDGFFAGPSGEIDWMKAIEKDDDYDAFIHRQSKSGGALLMGHTTYEMMKSYWPTAEALKSDPEMTEVMRNNRKYVVSKSLPGGDEQPNWKNIALIRDLSPKKVGELKREADITTLGSGSVVQQLAELELVDEYQLVVVPIILGAGKPLFKDFAKTKLKLEEAKAFKNGVNWLRYRPG